MEDVLKGVPAEDRRKLLYENAVRVYRMDAVVRTAEHGTETVEARA